MCYKFSFKISDRNDLIESSVEVLKSSPELKELEINGLGFYFHVFYGPHAGGYFICIPNWNIGSEMAGPCDVFWNVERLSNYTNLRPEYAELVCRSIYNLYLTEDHYEANV